MKKYILFFFLLLCISRGFSQFAKDSTELLARLETFMQYNRELNFEKIVDYTYPKLFTIAPKEQIQEAMESAFNNENLTINMDSIKVEKVFPLFASGRNKYAKIRYSMLVKMSPKEPGDSTTINQLATILNAQFGNENVRIDEKANAVVIYQKVDMAAIKDDLSPEWTFMNLKYGDPMMDQLLDQALLLKFYSF